MMIKIKKTKIKRKKRRKKIIKMRKYLKNM